MKISNPPKFLIVIISVNIIFGIGYFGVKQYQNYQLQNQERENLELQARDNEIKKLQQEVENLKNKPPQVIVNNANDKNDLSSIIKQWRPALAYIECQWNSMRIEKSGSGLFNNNLVVTNKHVLEERGIPADYCVVRLPSDLVGVSVPWTDFMVSKNSQIDLAMLKINQPTNHMKNLLFDNSICENRAEIGDEVLILGYPAIGSQEDITATEGIISGYESYYYITSAKLEHGNSGGLAVLVEDNCNLGVPTGTIAGEFESLGRIIDLNVAIPLTLE